MKVLDIITIIVSVNAWVWAEICFFMFLEERKYRKNLRILSDEIKNLAQVMKDRVDKQDAKFDTQLIGMKDNFDKK
jgi:hypothetical protein